MIRAREPGYDGGTLRVITLSGGICVYPYAASNVKQLIDNADMAVYNAKRSGKNKVVAYFLERPTEVTGNVLSMVKPGTYEEYAPTIYALTAAIDAKDHYTFNHSQNVADYSMALAEAIGLNREHVAVTVDYERRKSVRFAVAQTVGFAEREISSHGVRFLQTPYEKFLVVRFLFVAYEYPHQYSRQMIYVAFADELSVVRVYARERTVLVLAFSARDFVGVYPTSAAQYFALLTLFKIYRICHAPFLTNSKMIKLYTPNTVLSTGARAFVQTAVLT